MPEVSVTNHHKLVRSLGCIVSSYGGEIELHHCHGGSMRELGPGPGMAQCNSDWLVIPLRKLYHTGALGIDSGLGVESWEESFGRQVDHLTEVSELLGYNVFKAAGYDRDIPGLD